MNANIPQQQVTEAQQQHQLAIQQAAVETCKKAPNVDRLDTSVLAAKQHAVRSADETMLPQTIFRTSDTAGWWHTNAFAPILNRAEVFATILPGRYFQ